MGFEGAKPLQTSLCEQVSIQPGYSIGLGAS